MSFDTTYYIFVDRVLSGEYLSNLLGAKSSRSNSTFLVGRIFFLSTKSYPISREWSPIVRGVSTVWKYCIEIDCRYSHLIPFRAYVALLVSKKISDIYGADVLGNEDKEYGFYIRSGKTYVDEKTKFLSAWFPIYDEYYTHKVKFVSSLSVSNSCGHFDNSNFPIMLIDGGIDFPFSFFYSSDAAADASEKPRRGVVLGSGFYQVASGDIDASVMGSGLSNPYFVKASALDPEFSEICICAIFTLCHDMVRMDGITDGVEIYVGNELLIKIEGGVTYYSSEVLRMARKLQFRMRDLYLMDLPFLAGV